MLTLTPGVEVEVDPPPLPTVIVTAPATLVATVDPPEPILTLTVPAVAPVIVEAPSSGDLVVVPVVGPKGADGAAAGHFEYLMPIPQTTVLIDHPLGYDPVAVQVLVDGEVCSEYSVVFTVPEQQVRIAFDVSVQAMIRLM